METPQARTGRPRSEQARVAVLHAVDDLLVDVGYAAMTMKGIAERAGVGRQTVYRWWSTKAEILAEASADDAAEELAIADGGDARERIAAFLDALLLFLTTSPSGTAYRALLAAAQHDAEVAELIASRDPVVDAARRVLDPLGSRSELLPFLLTGPPVLWVLGGGAAHDLDRAALIDSVLAALENDGAGR